ncbi:MAG: SPFH domain-containing protein [Eggerthellaceae bacterium]|nr:SPFH domain-containing protein [Eggerthellaceae bacterium]
MGLISAALAAGSTVLGDQWKEYFYHEAMPADVLVSKGKKRVGGRSSNVNGVDNIISNGSVIAINEGQCMMIVEQGKVIDLCAEAGEYVYDQSSEPSIFCGDLSQSIMDVFYNVAKRFTFGGDAPKDQRVYYFNTKELVGNKFGTPNPVPFRVIDARAGIDMDVSVTCFGEYSYRLVNPILFYTNICGNVQSDYTRQNLDSQLKSELLSALQPAFAKVSENGVRYSQLPAHTTEFVEVLNEVLSAKWRNLRGIEIVSMGINSIKATDADEDRIKRMQQAAAYTDPNLRIAGLASAQMEAQVAAASNEAGAATGFIGMGMANAMGAANSDLYATKTTPVAGVGATISSGIAAPVPVTWDCACGATGNTGKFCGECGAPKPADGWKCECGAVNKGKFCSECGKPKPASEPLYKCDKCGWEPEDPKNPPKFCPECGDPFTDADKQ